jgi:hypothetical protein
MSQATSHFSFYLYLDISTSIAKANKEIKETFFHSLSFQVVVDVVVVVVVNRVMD